MIKIDIGCGNRPRKNYIGVDKYIRKSFSIRAEALHLPFKDFSVDAINCFHMIEHVPHTSTTRLFEEFSRVLKPRGKLELSCPDFERMLEMWLEGDYSYRWGIGLAKIFGWQRYFGDFHYTGFNRKRLVRLLNKNNFEVIKIENRPSQAKKEIKQFPDGDLYVEAHKRMNVSVVIVAIGMWEKYTRNCIESIQKCESTTKVICVNNGNKITQEQKEEVSNVSWVDSKEVLSYAVAINRGVESIKGANSNDWVLVINNDVLCTEPFFETLEFMERNDALYGNLLHISHRKFDLGHPWIDEWLYAFQWHLIDNVGFWDENFKTAAFEGADFSRRAFDEGYDIMKSYLPFTHLETHMRLDLENFSGERLDNLNYLMDKYELRGSGKNLKCYLY